MKKQIFTALLALLAIPSFAQRIVVLTPDVADIVAQIGAEKEVVGIHEFNRNPVYKNIPTIGFYRNFSSEPILAKKPDLVIGSWMAKPDGIYAQINRTGVHAENVIPSESLEQYQQSFERIGKLLNKMPQASALAQRFKNNIKQLPSTGKRYILSYDGRYVSGKNTVGDTLIKLAGGINAAASVDGLKPFSREAWLTAKPDVIIIAKHNEKNIGGLAKVLARPEIAASPAAKNKHVLFWEAEDYMRYGLYTPDIVGRLNRLGK
ncbi:MAG: ABC transporter substrate-binding protein [Neisseria sp.]|uniref:heme/hemin ABC transporter substrate-binding protein n=1 Tax=Neisseria sp. TaxID=192066 RepID=UPI0026DD1B69|nr:ABC transporter substrate-binding protein [Neisseria sp.]MDO4640613.1 ABC transporter substrate-binding protein [Neisseria sp.]